MSVWEVLLVVAALVGIAALSTLICLAIIHSIGNTGRRN